MITKNAKTILFASLIAALILPFSGMNNAQAEEQTVTFDTGMVEYLSKVIQSDEKMVERKVIEGKTYAVNKRIQQTGDNEYKVINKVRIDGELQSRQVFHITENDDGTFTLENESNGTTETFTKEAQTVIFGAGYSSSRGAVIHLNDEKWGSVNTVNLYDNYSACNVVIGGVTFPFNQGVMEADVKTSVVDVTWEVDPFYLHSCFQPHQWERGFVDFESQRIYLDSDTNQSDRASSHAFTNTLNTYDTYEVDMWMYYGAW